MPGTVFCMRLIEIGQLLYRGFKDSTVLDSPSSWILKKNPPIAKEYFRLNDNYKQIDSFKGAKHPYNCTFKFK